MFETKLNVLVLYLQKHRKELYIDKSKVNINIYEIRHIKKERV